MKYTLLTKEQLESLSKEFSMFLGSQQIDAKEWIEIKKNKPKVAQEELEIFCDLVWEDVLSKTKHIEHFSKQQLDLFNCGSIIMHRIVIKSDKIDFDFFNENDFKWFLSRPNNPSFTFFQAQKKYVKDRNLELFDLIKKGGIIANGNLYNILLKQLK